MLGFLGSFVFKLGVQLYLLRIVYLADEVPLWAIDWMYLKRMLKLKKHEWPTLSTLGP